jgi:hypothetical protein
LNVASAALEVSAGDYFELMFFEESDTSIDFLARDTRFGIEEVNAATFSGALVGLSSDLTGVNYVTPTAVPWDTEVYDHGNWYSGANPTRMTVPSGVSYVRATARVDAALINSNDSASLVIRKNGSEDYNGVAGQKAFASTTDKQASVATGIIPCAPGDYFETYFSVTSDTSITIPALNLFFAVEKVA